MELLAEDLLHHLGLALAQHAVVDKDASQLVADRTVHERGHHGGVHAAGEGEDDLLVPHLLADLRDLVLHDVVHGPGGHEAADVKEEVREQLAAVLGVAHLGVELRGVEVARRVLHGGHGAGLGRGRHRKARRHLTHGVAVAHPHGLLGRRVAVDAGLTRARDVRGAVLALVRVADRTAQLHGHDLLTVAEAEDGQAHVKDGRIHIRRVFRVDGGGAAGQDDRGGADRCEFGRGDIAGENLRIHMQVTDATRDELPVLGAKVEYGNELIGTL